jgi:hypothetical protein
MAVVLLDDHLLRDWLAGPDKALKRAVGPAVLGTTNLWYARLCKSALRHSGGALLGSWSEKEREVVVAGLIALPESIHVVAMTELAWRMGRLALDHAGLSMLGAEAVAAAERLGARVLVSALDDGPGIRSACESLCIRYQSIPR